MNKRFVRTLAKILGAIFILVILLVLVGPFLIPITPLEGLASAQQVATNESKFITIPFPGTDGIDIHHLSNDANATDEAPTFVLLHGSNFNSYTWTEVVDFFGQQGHVGVGF